MNRLFIPMIVVSDEFIPSYETELAAGADLRANIENDLILQPLQRALVPTGVFVALPEGKEAQIRPRSGLAVKKGITVLNSPGTIDAKLKNIYSLN